MNRPNSSRFFPLAPMSRGYRILTVGVFLLPIPLLFIPMLWPTGLLMLAIFGGVYVLLRPTGFEVAPGHLRIVFPWRSKEVSRINQVEAIDRGELRRRFGGLVRVGAGGLWGAFGYLWSPRAVVETYISRGEGLLLLERPGGKPLLLSPADPAGMAQALQAGG